MQQKRITHLLSRYTPVIIAVLLFIVLTVMIEYSLRKPEKPREESSPTQTASVMREQLIRELPTRYGNEQIPQSIWEQGIERYHAADAKRVKDYVRNIVLRYYIFRDVLSQSDEPYEITEEFSFAGFEREVPKMQAEVLERALQSVDLLYLKADFKNSPTAQPTTKDRQDARATLETYAQLLRQPDVDVQEVLRRANDDPLLLQRNNGILNEYRSKYTPQEGLFYTDSGFHPFLAQQEVGVPSDLYELKDGQGTPYAYVLLYLTRKGPGEAKSIPELLQLYEPRFR